MTARDNSLIILVAPNVTEQMGGEGIKALQIFQELKKRHKRTIQITHERNQSELSDRLKVADVYYVKDSWVSLFIWHSVLLRKLLDWWFSYKAVRLANDLAEQSRIGIAPVVIWQTEPNSPVIPRAISRLHLNCFGPINGNIYYPDIFRSKETLSAKLRRIFHMPAQRLNRWLFRGITKADLIFCAGGERTKRSLLARGCPGSIQVASVDCGINDSLFEHPRVTHQGKNLRFIHYRAGNFHKGTYLIIESLTKTSLPIVLDIVGRGPELERCKRLVQALDLTTRVNFLGWFRDRSELFKSLGQYRGFVLPSIEDANGIAVQEAMAVGLPAICLNWGGPQLLVDHSVTGFLIDPTSVDYITTQLARHMDALGSNGELAELMSVRSREKAMTWRWSEVICGWHRDIAWLIESHASGSST